MNVSLEGGQSATLRERLTYAQARMVRAAYYALEGNPMAQADLDLAMVKAYVSGWNVLDLDGKAVSLDTPELAPDEVIQAIFHAAADLFGLQKVAVPKDDGDASSPTTSPELPSELKMTPRSQTLSFSTSTQDGPGTTS